MRMYGDIKRCAVCGKNYTQFICVRCDIMTEPQYHAHKEMVTLIKTIRR